MQDAERHLNDAIVNVDVSRSFEEYLRPAGLFISATRKGKADQGFARMMLSIDSVSVE